MSDSKTGEPRAADSKAENLIWIDLEMTGLDTDADSIIEIATIITNSELEEIAVAKRQESHKAGETTQVHTH